MKSSMNFAKSLFKSIVLSAALSFLMASCGNKTEPSPETADVAKPHTAHSSVSLTRQQFNSIKIQIGSIEKKNLTGTLRASGFLKVPPQNKASITSPVGGTVRSILVHEGDLVAKGQILATLENPDFIKLQQDYLETQSELTFATAELKRQKELSEKNVSAQKIYQRTESDFNSLTVKYNALKKQLSLLNVDAQLLNSENISSEVNIKSPIKGNISHISVNLGMTVEPTGELMNIVDNSQLHVDIFVYEQDLGKVKTGQNVDILLTNLPGKSYTAKIFSIGSAFEGESKSISVHAAVTGEKTGLIEGMNITANIAVENNTVPAVPESAIISFGGNDYIFIQDEMHSGTKHKDDIHTADSLKSDEVIDFRRIAVKRGITDSGYTEIIPLEELSDDAKVVVNGSYYLMTMMTNESGQEH